MKTVKHEVAKKLDDKIWKMELNICNRNGICESWF